LLAKYIEALHGVQSLETVRLGSSNGVIEVEAVGLDKIRGKLARLEKLREISLDFENVSTADPPGEIKKKCPSMYLSCSTLPMKYRFRFNLRTVSVASVRQRCTNTDLFSADVRGLDITKNLLRGWDTVASIACELVYLERLALKYASIFVQFFKHLQQTSQNRFVLPSDYSLMASAFSNLIELQLNGTLTTWHQLTQFLLPYMPKIELVEMGYNGLTRLCVELKGLTATGKKPPPSTIQTLNLDGNNLSDWNDICRSIDPYPTSVHTTFWLISIDLSRIRTD
jgi:tubulin-specific chaperone E